MNTDLVLYIIAAVLLALDTLGISTPPVNKFSGAAFCLVLSLII